MDDVELKSIHLQFPTSLRLSNLEGATEQRVRTDRGDLVVAVQGDRASRLYWPTMIWELTVSSSLVSSIGFWTLINEICQLTDMLSTHFRQNPAIRRVTWWSWWLM